jgi:hypothetical protein
VGDDEVRQRRIGNAGGIEVFAGDGGADDREDARTDDGPNAQRGQGPGAEGLFEPVLGFFRVPDQLIDGFAG